MTEAAGLLCSTEYDCNEIHWPVHDGFSDVLSDPVKKTSSAALATEDERRGFANHGSDQLADGLSVGDGPLNTSYSGANKPERFGLVAGTNILLGLL